MSTQIKIKETKNAIVAEVNGIFGQLVNNNFLAYSESDLIKKTAYKIEDGWSNYNSIEHYVTSRVEEKKQRQIRNEIFAENAKIQFEKEMAILNELIAAGPIPATVDNILLVLKKLNSENWGGWILPKLTIGYRANQYNCDGVTATTIELLKPISDDEWNIENETKFEYGAPNGHLAKYRRLR